MAERYYTDPTGVTRDVAYHFEPEDERQFATARSESIEAVLDTHVARGAIQMHDRAEWRDRLRREPELAEEILISMRGDDILGDRAFTRDDRIRSLGHQLNAYMGVDPVELLYAERDDEARAIDPTGMLIKPGSVVL